VEDGNDDAVDDERRDDRSSRLQPVALALASVPGVQRFVDDPALAKELLGRRTARSGGVPVQRDAVHAG
jgi:hypothetical protein